MPIATLRRHAYSFRVVLVLGPLAGAFLTSSAWADHAPPTAALRSPSTATATTKGGEADRQPFAPRGSSGKRASKGQQSSSHWWLGTGGIALALAACGGLSIISKRYLPARQGSGSLRVIGRTSLSPKHSVYLLEVGQRVLVIGTGGQGPPSLLGELTDIGVDIDVDAATGKDKDRAGRESHLTTAGPTLSVSVPTRSGPSSATRFDRRIGDDE